MINIMYQYCAYENVSPISIQKFISTNDYIKQSACIVQEDKAIVAVLTKPIYTLSEREKLIKQVAKDVATQFKLKQVTVTFDSDIFCKIELKSATLAEIKDVLNVRDGNYEYIADN